MSWHFLAVDPGMDGGLCAMDGNGRVVRAEPLPIAGKLLDTFTMTELISDAAFVVIEQQHFRAGDGAKVANTLMPQYGQLIGLCGGLFKSVTIVPPREWKGVTLKGTLRDKAAAIDWVAKAHPRVNLRPGRKRKAHDGIADAVCIAHWAYRTMPCFRRS